LFLKTVLSEESRWVKREAEGKKRGFSGVL